MVADWEILSNKGCRGSDRIADKQKTKSRDETLKKGVVITSLIQASYYDFFISALE